MKEKAVRRDVFFDTLKFFLISLVILGHTIEVSEGSRLGRALYNTIYSFHMPLFIFVSGYFSKRYDDRSIFYRKILLIVETYLFFQFVFSLYSILSGNILRAIIKPWWVLWYLFSLIAWRLLLQITPPTFMKDKWKIAIGVVVVLSLSAGFVPLSYEFSFQRTMTFLPFFAIGYICANLKEFNIKTKLPSKILSILYFFVLFVAFNCIDKSFSGILYGSSPYNSLLGLCGRFVQLILGCLGGICFMGLIQDVKIPESLKSIGSNTLFFFVYHAFFIYACKKLNFQFNLISAVLVYISIMVSLYALSHIHLLHSLLNPISSFYDKKNTSNRRR